MFAFKVDDEIDLELINHNGKEELFRLIDDNREHLRKWLVWVDRRTEPDDFDSIIHSWIQKYADGNGFDAGLRYNGKLVGMLGLHYIDWKNKSTSIGYFLAEEMQGRGIITRAIKALMPYLFHSLNLHRIEIQVAAGNLKSMAVPERLGFFKEGILRDGQWLYDHFEDLITYSLLKTEWHLHDQTIH